MLIFYSNKAIKAKNGCKGSTIFAKNAILKIKNLK